MPTRPIGVFDSGAGGLSVWREIRKQLPEESTIYLADQAHVPYGPRTQEEIRAFCEGITTFLLAENCKAIVVACNTASAAALKQLREQFPDTLIIGMEPAVKPAVEMSASGVIGIMATQATFQGRLFTATVGRHAQNMRLVNQICHGLAEHVESGQLDGPATEALLMQFLQPMLDAQADTVVLACTHYPFLLPVIRKLLGPDIQVIDPAPAIARHLASQLALRNIRNRDMKGSTHRLLSTASVTAFSRLAEKLLDIDGCQLASAQWSDAQPARLHMAGSDISLVESTQSP